MDVPTSASSDVIPSNKTNFSDPLMNDMLNRTRLNSVDQFLSDRANQTFQVTPEGVALPKGYEIQKNLIENPANMYIRDGSSYGTYVNGKFKETFRIDQATPPGMKSPNNSHFHLNNSGKHHFNPNKLPK